MSALLGLTSFGFGILPLSFSFSKTHLSRISCVGTGLLLGTALGVIIPEYVCEGIETLVHADSTAEVSTTLALALLSGFALMILVEEYGSSHGHGGSSAASSMPKTQRPSHIEFDVELAALENEGGIALPRTPAAESESDQGQPAYPLTVGLVIHGFADGLALGVSALSAGESSNLEDLSLVVFFALAIHKAPTALAFTISLLSTSLSRSECRRHLAIFSSSTPVGAVVSYALFSMMGHGDLRRVGIALLFSGGSFLYVATVLQSPSHGHVDAGEVSRNMRVTLLLVGIFIPLLLSAMLDHHH
ncbi:Zinc/iron permease [Amylostereum chailletii]|nr:Zinc/iron permease [Amylostereum chailletii]